MAKAAAISVIDEINKRFGDGSIMSFAEGQISNIEAISTGLISLDKAIGIGGIPKGRITEIAGVESSGKSTLCLHLMAEAQKADKKFAAYIDIEHAFDPSYAVKCGVDLSRLHISQPDNAEQALEICELLIRSGECSIVVVDSVAALVPKAEIDGDMEDTQIGLQARLMSKAMRKLTGAISKSNTAVVFTNQFRQKIGVMFGSNKITSGGDALKYYASVRLELRRIQSIKQNGEIVGSVVRIKVNKNKVAPPFGEVEVEIEHGEGFSKYSEIIDLATGLDVLERRASYYFYQGEKVAQGKPALKAILKENSKLYEELKTEVVSQLGKKTIVHIEPDIELEQED